MIYFYCLTSIIKGLYTMHLLLYEPLKEIIRIEIKERKRPGPSKLNERSPRALMKRL
jgi:hypothetical protein